MSPDSSESTGESFGLLLIPGFSLMTFASAVEPLRQANRMNGAELYRWPLLSVDGRPVPSSAGSQMMVDRPLDAPGQLDRLFVCAGLEADAVTDRRLLARLRHLDRTGVPVAALSTASYILARAGLLDGYRCTIHWESLAPFRENFPELDLRANLFEIDRERITCAGATACTDLMLHLIEQRHGQGLAAAITAQFNMAQVRLAEDAQTIPAAAQLRSAHPVLLASLALMEANLEEPLNLGELAQATGLSKRQLERVFQRQLGCSVMRHYKALRLHRARLVLRQSSLAVIEVALACGFRSLSDFSRSYAAHFTLRPNQERRGARFRPSD